MEVSDRAKRLVSSKCRQLRDCLAAFQLHQGTDPARVSIQAKQEALQKSQGKEKGQKKKQKDWLTPHRSQIHKDKWQCYSH